MSTKYKEVKTMNFDYDSFFKHVFASFYSREDGFDKIYTYVNATLAPYFHKYKPNTIYIKNKEDYISNNYQLDKLPTRIEKSMYFILLYGSYNGVCMICQSLLLSTERHTLFKDKCDQCKLPYMPYTRGCVNILDILKENNKKKELFEIAKNFCNANRINNIVNINGHLIVYRSALCIQRAIRNYLGYKNGVYYQSKQFKPGADGYLKTLKDFLIKISKNKKYFY